MTKTKKSLMDSLDEALTSSPEQPIARRLIPIPDRRGVGLPDSPTVGQTDNPAVQPSNSPAVQQPDNQTVQRPDSPVVGLPDIPNYRKHLSDIQYKILSYLVSLPEKQTCRRWIGAATGVSTETVKVSLKSLTVKGFIGNQVTIKTDTFQGISYSINEPFCRQIGIDIPDGRSVGLPDSPTVQQPDRPVVHSSSNSLLETTSTISSPTVGQSGSADCFVLTGPEMEYWKESGLQERQALAWCKEFEVSPEELRQQLAWIRHDLIGGKESGIDNLVNWVYGVFKKTACCYPRPIGYRTPAEIRRDNIKAQLEAEQQVRDELAELERSAQFNAIINNPDGEEYLRLFNQLNEFSRKLKGKLLHAEMRRVWEES